MKRKMLVLLAIVAVACWAGAASATTILSTPDVTNATNGMTASAIIDLTGTTLTITITASGAAATNPADVLVGFAFNGTSATLTPVSATANAVLGTPTSTDFGPDWAYAAQGYPGTATSQLLISTGSVSGIGSGNFGGTPAALDGANFGAVSLATILNTPLTNQEPFAQNKITFVLTGAPADLKIGSVAFIYGTALGEIPPSTFVPIPPTVWMLGSGLLGISLLGWRRRKHLG